MDGTAVTPEHYSGRLSIPLFQPVAQIPLIRISCNILSAEIAEWPNEHHTVTVSEQIGKEVFTTLAHNGYHTISGNPASRSAMTPQWFMTRNKQACARLEDTQRAKRLFDSDDQPIHSAHLACFAAHNPTDAMQIICTALRLCHQRQIPALFVCLPPDIHATDLPTLNQTFSQTAVHIYAHGLPQSADSRATANPADAVSGIFPVRRFNDDIF